MLLTSALTSKIRNHSRIKAIIYCLLLHQKAQIKLLSVLLYQKSILIVLPWCPILIVSPAIFKALLPQINIITILNISLKSLRIFLTISKNMAFLNCRILSLSQVTLTTFNHEAIKKQLTQYACVTSCKTHLINVGNLAVPLVQHFITQLVIVAFYLHMPPLKQKHMYSEVKNTVVFGEDPESVLSIL